MKNYKIYEIDVKMLKNRRNNTKYMKNSVKYK